jgi:enoyl-CoA hydratase/carnithine racemase
MNDRVTLTLDAGVADVRLVRTDKMNALDNAMFEALVAAGERLKTEKGLRAVVLSGEGRAFCAGLDMGNFQRVEAAQDGGPPAKVSSISDLGPRTHGMCNRPQYAAMVWREIPVPVIAAVHGVAFGGGFQLCLGADMRYVTADARLSVMEIKWGLFPDMGGTVLMRHLAREDLVRELTYTGRVFSGEEAFKYGLATRVCADPRAEALAVAREIAGKSPTAIRAAKQVLNAAVDWNVAEGLQRESDEQVKLIGSPNQVEAILANLQNRPPVFVDP